MNRLKILLATIALAVTVLLASPMIVNPILKKKILLTLHQKYPGYDRFKKGKYINTAARRKDNLIKITVSLCHCV